VLQYPAWESIDRVVSSDGYSERRVGFRLAYQMRVEVEAVYRHPQHSVA
jgi:hypothetical protein